MRLSIKILLAILIIIKSSFLLYGQTGKISGQVVEKESGEPVPFANILLLGKTIGALSDIEFIMLRSIT